MFSSLRRMFGRAETTPPEIEFEPVYGLPRHEVEAWLARNPHLRQQYEVDEWLAHNPPLKEDLEAVRKQELLRLGSGRVVQ